MSERFADWSDPIEQCCCGGIAGDRDVLLERARARADLLLSRGWEPGHVIEMFRFREDPDLHAAWVGLGDERVRCLVEERARMRAPLPGRG